MYIIGIYVCAENMYARGVFLTSLLHFHCRNQNRISFASVFIYLFHCVCISFWCPIRVATAVESDAKEINDETT